MLTCGQHANSTGPSRAGIRTGNLLAVWTEMLNTVETYYSDQFIQIFFWYGIFLPKESRGRGGNRLYTLSKVLVKVLQPSDYVCQCPTKIIRDQPFPLGVSLPRPLHVSGTPVCFEDKTNFADQEFCGT